MDTLYDVRKFSPLLEIDAILDQHKITPHMVQEIESLRPF